MPCWTVMIESALFYLDLAVFRCHISIHELLEAVFSYSCHAASIPMTSPEPASRPDLLGTLTLCRGCRVVISTNA